MKKKIVIISLIILVMAIIFCYVFLYFSRSVALCGLRGGTIHSASSEAGTECIIKYPDGGRKCTNSLQCLGGCVTDKVSQLGKEGICKINNSNQGCFTKIEEKEIRCLLDDMIVRCPGGWPEEICQAHQ